MRNQKSIFSSPAVSQWAASVSMSLLERTLGLPRPTSLLPRALLLPAFSLYHHISSCPVPFQSAGLQARMWSCSTAPIQRKGKPFARLSLGTTLLERVVAAGCPRHSPCFPTQLSASKTAAPAQGTVTCSGQSELSTQASSPMQPSLKMFVFKMMKM